MSRLSMTEKFTEETRRDTSIYSPSVIAGFLTVISVGCGKVTVISLATAGAITSHLTVKW